jgi:hypothetical protein
MMFNEKLDLLMNLSGTSNSVLARQVNLDASYISRLRRGDRAPSKNENYLMAISQYFAKQMTSDVFKSGLSHALHKAPSHMPIELEPASRLIFDWLCDQKSVEHETIGSLLDQVSNFSFAKSDRAPVSIPQNNIQSTAYATYFGLEGKRAAVVELLTAAVASNKTETLYLYSDESIEWLMGDKKFTALWGSMMQKVIQKGHRIIIIHTVNRGLEEMLTSIREWLPLYMTGALEPYYYPRTRDEVYRRTLFVLGEQMALSSQSIGHSEMKIMIHKFIEPDVVHRYQQEFSGYLSKCRPLMRIMTPRSKEAAMSIIHEFEAEPAPGMLMRQGLSLLTLPPQIAQSLLEHNGTDPEFIKILVDYQNKKVELFTNCLKGHEHIELLVLPDRKLLQQLRKAKNGKTEKVGPQKITLGFTGIIGLSEAEYNAAEYVAHLERVIELLNTCPNYHVLLLDSAFASGCSVFVKDQVGVLIIKDKAPHVLFAINESRLTAAFSDYVSQIAGKFRLNETERKLTLRRLESMRTTLVGRSGKNNGNGNMY